LSSILPRTRLDRSPRKHQGRACGVHRTRIYRLDRSLRKHQGRACGVHRTRIYRLDRSLRKHQDQACGVHRIRIYRLNRSLRTNRRGWAYGTVSDHSADPCGKERNPATLTRAMAWGSWTRLRW